MNFKDKLVVYLHNKDVKCDNEYVTLLHNYRYRQLDESDLLELIISKARADLMREITDEVFLLLKGNKL